ncbi:MAG: hypothetical protein JW765_00485 [Deltaproteobacteria bacterium]|nr:hypothetical protein [Candidatus Zymogenaceae bacterium]
MNTVLFFVSAVAAGIVQGFLFPPGPWSFGGEGYWIAFFLNWDLNLLLTLVLFFLVVDRQPKALPKGSKLRTVIRWLAAVSTVLLGGVLLLFMESRVTAGLVVLWWVLLWFYLYTVLEQLKRLVKAFERAELFRILILFLTLVFNWVAFSIAFGVRGGSIDGYLLVFIAEFAVAFVVVGGTAFFFGHDTPQAT